MTFQESLKSLCTKLNIDYDEVIAGNNDLFSEDDLKDFIKFGVIDAWSYKPWDFAEGSKTATTVSDMLTSGYADYPNDFLTGSIHLLKVNGKEYRKLSFQDYQKFNQDYPNNTNRYWTEQKRFIFINPNSYTAGQTLDLFGKLMPPVLSNPTDLLPFSPDADNYEDSGNKAIVLLAYADALASEKKKAPDKAEIERGKAYQLLDLIWKPMADARSLLQNKNRPFFFVPDYFNNGGSGRYDIGNFHYLD